MAERGADQHRARDAPEEDQRLAVVEREARRDRAVQHEGGENPGRDVRLGEAAARADRQDDRHRPARREQERDESGGSILNPEVPARHDLLF